MTAVVEDLVDAVGTRSSRRPLVTIAATLLALIVGAIVAVFAVQAAGFPPCELCLKERLPYYGGMALAAGAVPLAARASRGLVRLWFAAIAALFLASAALGAYHAGVEWGWWAGPTDCTGALSRAATNADFLHQLRTVHVVRCDAAALRILGLSLAGWNAIASLGIAGLAALGAGRAGGA